MDELSKFVDEIKSRINNENVEVGKYGNYPYVGIPSTPTSKVIVMAWRDSSARIDFDFIIKGVEGKQLHEMVTEKYLSQDKNDEYIKGKISKVLDEFKN